MEDKDKKIEIRQNKAEFRAFENDEGVKGIEGYALLYDKESRLISSFWDGEFYEVIQRGSFDKVLASPDLNVKLYFNHIKNTIIARTKSGTLKLVSDERGLKYIVEDIGKTTDALDLYERIKRGDIYESSFAFMIADDGQNWTKRADGANLRTVTEASYLDDVSPVTDGAYANTDVAVRSLQAFLKPDIMEIDESYLDDLDLREKELEILKFKK